ncbi:MAG: hypothetical protein IJC04_04365 [Oscillospiraceae bacterium]|nr:hypothetical protein [Oscillospiraceae bacterium]
MFKKLLPHNKASIFWFAAIPFIAGAALFAKKTHTVENGRSEDVYLIGKKGSPKAVFVTNQTPKKALKNAVGKYIDSIKD